jgi:hypothetical protein
MKHLSFVALSSSRTSIAASMFAASMLAASLLCSGCSAIRVKLGMRIPLDKIPVASMQASLPNDPGIAPGEKSPLVVQVTATDGKLYQTEGKGKGKVQWKDLSVQTEVVTASKKGVLSLAHDPRVSDGKTGHVTITAPAIPAFRPVWTSPCATITPSKPPTPAPAEPTASMERAASTERPEPPALSTPTIP